MSSETIELDIESFDLSVINLKEKIAEVKDTSKDLIRLIFSGKILEDSKSLESYNIKENLTIICLISKKKKDTEQSTQNSTQNNVSSDNTNQEQNTSFGSMPSTMPSFGSMPSTMPSFGSMPNFENIQMMNTFLQNPQMSQMMSTLMGNPEMRSLMVNSTLQNMNIPNDSPMREFYENALVSLFNNPEQYLSLINNLSQMPQFSNPNNEANINSPNMNSTNQTNFSNLSNSMNSLNNDENNIQTSTSSNEDEIQNSTETNLNELKEKYAEQIQQIKNMGFDDESKIIEVLEQSSGSVSIALNKLFE